MTRLKVGDIAIAPEGCKKYLTPNKEYEIKQVNDSGSFYIEGNQKQYLFCLQSDCAHIGNQDWIFKTESKNK
jgi:hypothetical protein